ncbi:hypothetical protein H4582DRAFT_1274748 [Lactarius indigo]|nr:hypothetical protein H4582DRAFT_1274748 [Lactarius indigo]
MVCVVTVAWVLNLGNHYLPCLAPCYRLAAQGQTRLGHRRWRIRIQSNPVCQLHAAGAVFTAISFPQGLGFILFKMWDQGTAPRTGLSVVAVGRLHRKRIGVVESRAAGRTWGNRDSVAGSVVRVGLTQSQMGHRVSPGQMRNSPFLESHRLSVITAYADGPMARPTRSCNKKRKPACGKNHVRSNDDLSEIVVVTI